MIKNRPVSPAPHTQHLTPNPNQDQWTEAGALDIAPIIMLSIAPDCLALPSPTIDSPLHERLTDEHKPLLSYLAELIKPAFKAIFVSASNTYPSGNPNTCCAQLLRASYEATCHVLKSQDISSNLTLDLWSFVDVLENKASGHTFTTAMQSSSTPNPLNLLMPHLLDTLPFMLLFAEMHRFMMQYPMRSNRQFYYFSTSTDVLGTLYGLFKDRLNLIPQGLTLNCCCYSLKASDIISLPPLQGTGNVDSWYADTVKSWARNLRKTLPDPTQPWGPDILYPIPSITFTEYVQYFTRLEQQAISSHDSHQNDRTVDAYQVYRKSLDEWQHAIPSMQEELKQCQAKDFKKAIQLTHSIEDLLQTLKNLHELQLNITRYLSAIQIEAHEINIQAQNSHQTHNKPNPLTTYLEQLGSINVIESIDTVRTLQSLIEQLKNKQKNISTLSKTRLEQMIWNCDLALTYVRKLQNQAKYDSQSPLKLLQFQRHYQEMVDIAKRIEWFMRALSVFTRTVTETENLKREAEKHCTPNIIDEKIARQNELIEAINWIIKYKETVTQPAQLIMPLGPTLHGPHGKRTPPPPLHLPPDSGFASANPSPVSK